MVYLYPTASTCAVFINGYHLEQAYQIQYKDSTPKIPIYGYNDLEFSKVIRGKGSVQGLLVINFVFAGYLTVVLDKQSDAYSPKLYNYGYTVPGTAQKEQYQKDLTLKMRNELPPAGSPEERSARAEYIASLLSRDRPSAIKKQTKEVLQKFFDSSELEGQQDIISIPNPLVVPPKSSAGNRLDVYYQDPNYVNWFVRFNDVHFSDVSQQISQAGAEGSSEPLYEVYSFLAKNRVIKVIGDT